MTRSADSDLAIFESHRRSSSRTPIWWRSWRGCAWTNSIPWRRVARRAEAIVCPSLSI